MSENSHIRGIIKAMQKEKQSFRNKNNHEIHTLIIDWSHEPIGAFKQPQKKFDQEEQEPIETKKANNRSLTVARLKIKDHAKLYLYKGHVSFFNHTLQNLLSYLNLLWSCILVNEV